MSKKKVYNYNNSKNFKLVKEITHQERKDLQWQVTAVQALNATTEAYAVGLFDDTKLVAWHAERISIQRKDMWLVCYLRGEIM